MFVVPYNFINIFINEKILFTFFWLRRAVPS